MSELPKPPIVLWMKSRESLVQSIDNVYLRIKNATKLGENLRGFADGAGDLAEMTWAQVVRLRPTVLEVNNSRNPFDKFFEAVTAAGSDQSNEFFSRLSLISLNGCDISTESFIAFLKKISLLQAFAYSDVHFTNDEWKNIASELSRLNLRAIDISSDILHSALPALNVEMLKLSGSPGVAAKAFKDCNTSFVTVKTLIAQELNFTNVNDAEEFLAVLAERFPRLSTLIWDWNMVDPAVVMDKRTADVLGQIIDCFNKINLTSMAIVGYSPCNETKSAFESMTARLASSLPGVRLFRFSSKGLESVNPNFSLIVAGQDTATINILHDIFVGERNSIPDLRHLMPLLPSSPDVASNAIIAEFAGFDADRIKKTFREKTWDDNITI